jgi:predicted enzyme related to lactoylglutathione lyase
MGDESRSNQGCQVETIIIFTPNMEELAYFYEKGLDIGPFERSPGHMGCQVGVIYLGFDEIETSNEGEPSGVSVWFTVDDLEEAFDQLLDAGAAVRYPPTAKPWGARLA